MALECSLMCRFRKVVLARRGKKLFFLCPALLDMTPYLVALSCDGRGDMRRACLVVVSSPDIDA